MEPGGGAGRGGEVGRSAARVSASGSETGVIWIEHRYQWELAVSLIRCPFHITPVSHTSTEGILPVEASGFTAQGEFAHPNPSITETALEWLLRLVGQL